MSAIPLLNTKKVLRPAPNRVNAGHEVQLPQSEFLNVLDWERQRSERSGNSLLLALIHLNGWQKESCNGDNQSEKTLADCIHSRVRVTDTVGWYQDGITLGVILTDVRISNATNAQASIDMKLRQVVNASISPETAAHIPITYHLFPSDDVDSEQRDQMFYPKSKVAMNRAACILKRCVDVTGSLLGLLAVSPLLPLIALAVKLSSEGPICCKQTRIGEGGRAFTFLKFRSMFHNSDPSLHRNYVFCLIAGKNVVQEDNGATGIYKIVDDPRITPVGKILRRTSLDELPQLVNVLKGDMSLVGPRPPLPYEFEKYSSWHRRRVLEIKPGLTGLWQVSGRSRTNFDEMVRLDLLYARQWSLWLDLKILLKTPAAVASGNGAY
jgi:lipopolysaccharide/colanic/teichoic acid biosynthesis glycosyltransferase